MNEEKQKPSAGNIIGVFLGRIIIFILITALMLAAAAYGICYAVFRGPSPSAARDFVGSLRQTSALYFVPELFFTAEELSVIEATVPNDAEYIPTDTSLIELPAAKEDNNAGGEDAYGLTDEDGDGIIVVPVKGAGYSGYMMVVLDPTRVIMGCVPEQLGRRGYTVEEFANYFDAVAAINGGGFEDANGQGSGAEPNSLVVFDGTVYWSHKGPAWGFGGIDGSGILHVAAQITVEDIYANDIRYGCCYGPVLVNNGTGTPAKYLSPGINPRTAIGQRADGAMLLLVVDGRQVISLGASYLDMENIMLEFGAVNAVGLDGGSSTMMWYNGEYINNCASVIGVRRIPTSFVVLKEGVR